MKRARNTRIAVVFTGILIAGFAVARRGEGLLGMVLPLHSVGNDCPVWFCRCTAWGMTARHGLCALWFDPCGGGNRDCGRGRVICAYAKACYNHFVSQERGDIH